MEAPLDRDLYQADKGLKNTEFVIRDGGIILLDASCKSGVVRISSLYLAHTHTTCPSPNARCSARTQGISHFVELMREVKTYDEALALVEARGYNLGDHKGVKLRCAARALVAVLACLWRDRDMPIGQSSEKTQSELSRLLCL